MSDNLNVLIVKTLQNLLPVNIKLPEYLMESLDISKQSAYRKIKGEIPFSFDQIAKLSSELNFSIDEIVGSDNNKYSLYRLQKANSDPEKIFRQMLDRYLAALMIQYERKDSGIIQTMNRISFLSGIYFDNLFRFFYYRWRHQMSEVPLDYYFADVALPAETILLCTRIKEYLPIVNNNTYIFDYDTFKNTLIEIQYYHKRKLVNNEELSLIKKELHELINYTEVVIRNGKLPYSDAKFYYYISSVPIETNSVFFWYDGIEESHFLIYSANYIDSSNTYACELHKKWLASLKKYSVFTTNSNEELQSSYCKKLREYTEKLLPL